MLVAVYVELLSGMFVMGLLVLINIYLGLIMDMGWFIIVYSLIVSMMTDM